MEINYLEETLKTKEYCDLNIFFDKKNDSLRVAKKFYSFRMIKLGYIKRVSETVTKMLLTENLDLINDIQDIIKKKLIDIKYNSENLFY